MNITNITIMNSTADFASDADLGDIFTGTVCFVIIGGIAVFALVYTILWIIGKVWAAAVVGGAAVVGWDALSDWLLVYHWYRTGNPGFASWIMVSIFWGGWWSFAYSRKLYSSWTRKKTVSYFLCSMFGLSVIFLLPTEWRVKEKLAQKKHGDVVGPETLMNWSDGESMLSAVIEGGGWESLISFMVVSYVIISTSVSDYEDAGVLSKIEYLSWIASFLGICYRIAGLVDRIQVRRRDRVISIGHDQESGMELYCNFTESDIHKLQSLPKRTLVWYVTDICTFNR